jgi:hypothetical protein
MTKFYFDVRDVLRAPRLALNPKKILLQFVGLLVGYLGYLFFTYLAFICNGFNLGEAWRFHGLFPLTDLPFEQWYGWLLWGLGVVWAGIWWLLASTMVGKVTYEQLKGDDFYSSKEAFRFLKKHWGPSFFTPLSLVVFIAVIIICGIIVGLLGKIPYVGELGIGIFFLVPLFAVALTLAYVIFMFFISLFLAPAVVATLKEDTFETIVQVFSTVWSQAWRFFVYSGLVGAMSKLGIFVFGYFCYRAVELINLSVGVFMKGKLADIFDNGYSYVTIPPYILDYFSNVFAGVHFGFLLPMAGSGIRLNWSGQIASFLIAISLILIIFMVLSYGLSIISTGQTLIYIVLRKKKDDENLLERKTETEEEEERREMEEKEKEDKEKQKEGEAPKTEEKPEEEKEEGG